MKPRLVKISVGIITVSDRAFSHVYADRSGPKISQLLNQTLKNPLSFHCVVVPDIKARIIKSFHDLCQRKKCTFIFTTGGTGPGKRDVTVEATEDFCRKILPGFGEAMRKSSLTKTPTAILSRQTAGIRGQTLIVNLPGNPQAVAICFQAIAGALADCIRVLAGPHIVYRNKTLNHTHH